MVRVMYPFIPLFLILLVATHNSYQVVWVELCPPSKKRYVDVITPKTSEDNFIWI